VFSGNAGEYFRIWIVNIALTIVTLGVYSAWATVRKRRYFYTHTWLADGTFDFHASPKAILIGRIIAVGILAAYLGSGYLHPLAPFCVMLFVALIFPWLVVRSRTFRMRTTSYRGIRFNFVTDYKEAFRVYYLSTLIIVFSLGLATGSSLYMRNKFQVSHSGFGDTRFSFFGVTDKFHSIFLKMLGLAFLMGVGGSFVIAAIIGLVAPAVPGGGSAEAGEFQLASMLLSQATLALWGLGYLAIGVYYQVRLRNYVWNTTSLGRNELVSTLSARSMIWIYITNILAIVFTLGLATPWAQIRTAKYRADNTRIVLADDWESYLSAQTSEGTAIGDEIGEAFDVDIGIGL
jgi:uncharacterized membrane protein YjgN (DUF898 family)